MNFNKIVTFLLLTLGFSGIATAHTQPGVLGRAKLSIAATDIYIISCDQTSSSLYFQVKDLPPKNPSVISIQATKDGLVSERVFDVKDGNPAYSRGVSFVAGPGDYVLNVNKSASKVKGRELYSAVFHCVDAAGNHTETGMTTIQNQ